MDYPDPKRSAATGLPLPEDPLVEVLSRVPVKDLHRSKCVSKGWRGLIADPLHRRKLPQTLQGFFHAGDFINPFGGSGSPPPVDPSFRFLKKLPGIGKIWLRGFCNGLLLFRHTPSRTISYIVCNPSTEQWAAVPSEHTPADKHNRTSRTYLVFDPAVSSHFQLVTFCEKQDWNLATVHTYSSKTGVWRHSQIDWAEEVKQPDLWRGWNPYISDRVGASAFCNGRLYFMLNGCQIAEVDVEGKTRGIIPSPSLVGRHSAGTAECNPIFIGQSQGHLYCINEESWVDKVPSELSTDDYRSYFDYDHGLLSFWVRDYDTQKWVLKLSVSHMHLFGRSRYIVRRDYEVVGIHPDSNFLFIYLCSKRKLISYSLDSKEVCAHDTLEQDPLWFTPYVPCFLDFLSVAEHDDKLKVRGKPSAKDVAGAADHSGQ
ncbi:unnamed protein product [Urochloa decumbens]|uniref:F-box domain-containing protein n=1 Tax=Urochloa decumbens TaxID=240449 RepID=A0ABC9G9I1_9POAL